MVTSYDTEGSSSPNAEHLWWVCGGGRQRPVIFHCMALWETGVAHCLTLMDDEPGSALCENPPEMNCGLQLRGAAVLHKTTVQTWKS